jgi:hypothetical protein
MARNIYFSEKVRSEQTLYEDIVVEALKIYGYDMYYLPRDVMKRDDLLNEDPSSRFNSSYMIEMYVDNVDGFDGQGDLFQKFGVEIRDAVTLTMSRRRWTQAIKRYDNELTTDRPLEGDLIYVPFSRKLFQIMKVEHEAPFYQLTNLPTYKLQCELFEYSGDDFDTGIEVIDQIERAYAYKYILSFSGGENATATLGIDSEGYGTAFTMTSIGSGYTSTPTVEVSAPTSSPRQAVARAYSDGNALTSIEVLDSGYYYLFPPTIELPDPTPGPNFRFGDNSLYHDSANARFTFPADAQLINNPLNDRIVYRFYYWAESSGQEYNALINLNADLGQLYHRTSDNKIIFEDSSISFASEGSIIPYDSDLDSGVWNYIELHLLNQQAKLHVNAVDVTPVNISPIDPTLVDSGSSIGAPVSATPINPLVTSSFKGYIDQFVCIQTRDTKFRTPSPLPVDISQVNRDGDTLVLGKVIIDFNNQRPTIGNIELNFGSVVSIGVGNGGTNMTKSSYDLVLSAPDGTAANFTATGTALLESDGTIPIILVDYPGVGYQSPPLVKIRPQGDIVSYAPGDKVYQTLATGVVLEADVTQFSDSDYRLHVVNVQTSDGVYHEFSTGVRVNRDSANGPGAFLISIDEVQQLSEIEQNDTFSTEAAGFLDFTETNPFGDPE